MGIGTQRDATTDVEHALEENYPCGKNICAILRRKRGHVPAEHDRAITRAGHIAASTAMVVGAAQSGVDAYERYRCPLTRHGRACQTIRQ